MPFRNSWALGLCAAMLAGSCALACRSPGAAPGSAQSPSAGVAAAAAPGARPVSGWRSPFQTLRGGRLYTAGTRALEAGETEAAIEALEEAARLTPQVSAIQNHLGLAYWAAGQPDRAGLAFDRALDLDCENEAAQRNREKLIQALASERPDSAEAARGAESEKEGPDVR